MTGTPYGRYLTLSNRWAFSFWTKSAAPCLPTTKSAFLTTDQVLLRAQQTDQLDFQPATEGQTRKARPEGNLRRRPHRPNPGGHRQREIHPAIRREKLSSNHRRKLSSRTPLNPGSLPPPPRRPQAICV